jgi:hypothetical protein
VLLRSEFQRTPQPGGVTAPRGLDQATSPLASITGPSAPWGRSSTISLAPAGGGFLHDKNAPPRLMLVQTTSLKPPAIGRISPVIKHG